MITTLLGGLSPTRFLRDVWHKRPLLIRNAVPGFTGLLSPEEMQHLASREDVESRLIQGSGTHWRLDDGPFRKATSSACPRPSGRCWCSHSIICCPKRMRCWRASTSFRMPGSTT
ncbi:MAG: hypothetical protein ACM3KD_01145 [Hyphomicrobiaceae bacterium]